MVIREWRGRAVTTRAAEYPRHFRNTVAPALKRVPGFLGAHLSERREDERVEFLVLTRWASMDAVRAFAGAHPEQAIVEPGAVVALSEYEHTVRHYEVIEDVDRE